MFGEHIKAEGIEQGYKDLEDLSKLVLYPLQECLNGHLILPTDNPVSG